MAAAPALVPGTRVTITGKESLGVGILRFFGATKFRAGDWAGVEIAKPLGKNDGSVQGVRYFTCKDKHGIFVPGHSVTPVQKTGKPASSAARSPKPTAKKAPASASPKPSAAVQKPAATTKASSTPKAAAVKATGEAAAVAEQQARSLAVGQEEAAKKAAAEAEAAAAERKRAALAKQQAAVEKERAAVERQAAAAEKERAAAEKHRAAAEKESAAAEQERIAALAREDAAKKQSEEAEASRAAAAAAAESARLGQAAAEAEVAKAKADAAAQAAAAMQDKEQADAARARAADAAEAAEVALKQQAAAEKAQADAEKEKALVAAQAAAAVKEKEKAEAAQAEASNAAKRALAEKAAAEQERAAAHQEREKASKAAAAALKEKEAALREQVESDRRREEAEKAQATASRKAEAALKGKEKAEAEKAAAVRAKEAEAQRAADALKDQAEAEAAAKAAQNELKEHKDAMAEFRTSSKALELEVSQLREEVAGLRAAKAVSDDNSKAKLADKASSLKDLEQKMTAQQVKIATLEKEKAKLLTQQQRETEKVAAAHKKELDVLTERAEEAEFNLENMQLDLEMAEEASSSFEGEVEALKGQLEIAQAQASTTSRSVDAESGDDESDVPCDDQLKENNVRLTAALMKLRDLSLAEKQQRDRRIKELEKENLQLPKLEEKLLQLETDLLQAEDNVEELKEQLDVALEAADVVDELSEKNMDLEDTVAELKQTVEDMEEMRDLSEELEAQQADTEKQLRKDLLLLEIKLQDQETVIGNVVAKIKDQEDTIVRYRGKVEELKEQLFSHSADHQESSAQAESLEGKATKLLEENISMRSQIEKLQGATVEKALGDLEMAAAEKRVQMLSAYVPADVIKEDKEAIDCHFLLQKLKDKCTLIGSQVKADSHIHDFIPATASDRNVDDRYFAYKLVRLLDGFELSASQLLHYLETVSDAEAWLEIRKIQWDLSGHTRVLDTLLQALLQGELSLSFDLLPLENATKTLFNIGERFNALPLTRPVSSGSQAIAYGCHFISMELSRLQRAMTLNNPSGDVTSDEIQNMAHISEARTALKPLLDACKSLTRAVGEGDHLGSADDDDLLAICASVSRGREQCSSLLQKTHSVLARVEKALNDLDAEERCGEDLRALIADSLEDAAFGDEFDSELPWAAFDAAVASLSREIAIVVPQLESWVDMHADSSVESREPAQTVRARNIMQELNSLNDLKAQISEFTAQAADQASTLAAQETTISEAQRTQTLLESRIASLLQREEELQRSVTEKEEELKKQAKTWEDALLSMQEDVDALEADNRTLADKLAQVRKHGAEPSEGSRSVAAVSSAPGEGASTATTAEVAGLRAGIEVLQRENALVRSHQAASSLKRLSTTPLASLARPSRQVISCRKRLLQLNEAAQRAYASPLIVSLTHLADGPTPATQRKAELSMLKRDAAEVRDALAEALLPQREGASSPSLEGRLVAKIKLPSSATGKHVRLPVGQEGLHKLHSQFA